MSTNTNTRFSSVTVLVNPTAAGLNLQAGGSSRVITVTATSAGDTLVGGGAGDTLIGGAGSDVITGGAGVDSLHGGLGDDSLVFSSTSELAIDTTVIGDAGTDVIRIAAGANSVVLNDGDLARVTGVEVLNLTGTAAQTVALGTAASAAFASGITLTANPAAVSLTVLGAAATVSITATGTNGADTMTGGINPDTLRGGAGDDLFVYSTLASLISNNVMTDSLEGGAGSDSNRVDAPIQLTTSSSLARADTVEKLIQNANGAANIVLSAPSQVAGIRTFDISASTAASTLTFTGFGQGVTIMAGAASDTLTGGSAADIIDGKAGADRLTGGGGDDTLTGGAGADRFVFEAAASSNGTDTLIDLVIGAGGDILDFSAFGIDGNSTVDNLTNPEFASVMTANPNNKNNVEGEVVRLVDIPGNQDITTAAGLQLALATGEYSRIAMKANSKAIIITSATNGATDPDYIFYATSDSGGNITVVLVGRVTGNVDIDSYVLANFSI